jgi:AraC family transcriptional regulator of adaptative response / DNA-3-methyladenine glycosylase II
VVDREGVSGLAARLGYSERQLHRLLVGELGAGPLAIARAQRAQTARALLVGTSLRLADVAFASGFGSIRQFNDTVAEVFGTTPSELRTRARRPAPTRAGLAPGASTEVGTLHRDRSRPVPTSVQGADLAGSGDQPVRISLALPVREPFDARGVLEFLAVRAVEGVESADLAALRYARTVALPHGPGAFEVRVPRPGGGRVELDLELSDLADAPVAVARVRRLLDLDADPVAVDSAIAADPVLAPSVGAVPGIRVPGTLDPAELLIRAIVGQQISVAAARTHLTRLATGLGAPYVSAFEGLTRLFPAPARTAAGAADHLRLPARMLATVTAAARDLADGTLALSVGDDPDDLRRRLVSRTGIGPWTAGYVALRVLGDPDVLMDGDVALLAGARNLGLVSPDLSRPHQFKELARRGAEWAPWRSYAAMHLWRSA